METDKYSQSNHHTEDENSIGSKSLEDILTDHFPVGIESENQSSKHDSKSKKRQESSRRLKFLRPIPWILGGLFLFSFWWDFDGIWAETALVTLQFDGLIRIISISGLIGFLTNRIAITMLFRPAKKRPILGQGLIPAHKDRIARRLAISVSDDMINSELIRSKLRESGAIARFRESTTGVIRDVLQKPEFRSDLKSWLSEALDHIISEPDFRERMTREITDEIERASSHKPIERAALKTYLFLRGSHIRDLVDEALHKLPAKLHREINIVDSILDDFPDSIDQNQTTIDRVATSLLDRLIRQLDVKKIVEENLKTYDEEKLEQMIKGATNEHLTTIQYLGAVLGTIGGFVIWEPILSLIIIGSLAGIIILLEKMLE
ncbi:DUF445 family protein [Rhodohalobacter sp. SW132]|uniref:DUF445 domain-containing protein n=1 Tax=Rhodohalobacter sp. SW132 TaxID=2293433 RepID=UPI000E22930E|nr:DUF445 family protein [Rhodohalobacter sp. SW132]REL37570.1 DUF445 family protein [Rhodohalobacter sp. SW132]